MFLPGALNRQDLCPDGTEGFSANSTPGHNCLLTTRTIQLLSWLQFSDSPDGGSVLNESERDTAWRLLAAEKLFDESCGKELSYRPIGPLHQYRTSLACVCLQGKLFLIADWWTNNYALRMDGCIDGNTFVWSHGSLLKRLYFYLKMFLGNWSSRMIRARHSQGSEVHSSRSPLAARSTRWPNLASISSSKAGLFPNQSIIASVREAGNLHQWH